MKLYKQLILILILFVKTETLLSENNLFSVNNIQLEKNNIANDVIVDQAIKKGFNELVSKILLKEDRDKLLDLNLSSIKQLVTYYQISNISDEEKKKQLINFNITFDKDKIHDLFYKLGISYSDVSEKELYILPIFIKDDEIFIFNKNFFYKNWNKIYFDDLIEFILPLENIEIIKKINDSKSDIINLELFDIFEEYKNKNLALVLIEDNKTSANKFYLKTLIQGKTISKNLKINNNNLQKEEFYKKIIVQIKKELVNIIKSKNLIDVRTPFFLNVKLNLNRSNLVELNLRLKKIDSIENIYVQEFNKNHMNLRIKYLGKLDKIIKQLKEENIDLKLINNQWVFKLL